MLQQGNYFLKRRNKFAANPNESSKRFYRYSQMALNSNGITDSLLSNIDKNKFNILQKIFYSLRLYKSMLPATLYIEKQVKGKKKEGTFFKEKSRIYRRTYIRGVLRRFSKKRHKKHIRRQKILRLKTVHFYVPAYLQMDFRTLRSVKIQSPAIADIHYSFRGSLAKVHSFYASRGF